MEDIMQVLYLQKKGAYLKNIERFYVQKGASLDNQLNDKHTIFSNTIFDTILKNETPLIIPPN
jgi:hypothetical protein